MSGKCREVPRWERDRCEWCGRNVVVSQWHPVASPPAAPEDRVYAFCSPDCRGSWLADLADG